VPTEVPAPAPTPTPSADVWKLPPASDLHDRALAASREADRQRRDEDARGPWMIKPKELPPSLKKLPPEAQTALAKRFDDRLAELVVISQPERQEGNYRVTIIETNKGRFCGYEPLVKPAFMGNTPQVATFGTCGPKS
jgi:hypothetical protein